MGWLILVGEPVQPVGLFTLVGTFGWNLPQPDLVGPGPCPKKVLCPTTVRGSPMVEGVRSGVIAKLGMAICVDGQLKVGGHFWQVLECGECVCV